MVDTEHGNPAYRALNPADKALCRALVLTTLRHKPMLDQAVAALLDRPLPGGARALSHVLAIAAGPNPLSRRGRITPQSISPWNRLMPIHATGGLRAWSMLS